MIAETFTEWRSRLVRYCTHLAQNRDDAEEVVQDVFARLLAEPGRFELGNAAEVLLFRMARNGCIDRRRKRTPRNNVDIDPPTPTESDHSDLEAALLTLPEAEREIVVLTAVDGLGYREVAEIVGCSLGTVAARRCAAIQKLRRQLTD